MPYDRLDHELRPKARELIQEGHLTCAPPLRVWGGYGSDLRCSLCEKPIRSDDIEYEIEQPGAASVTIYRFHFDCHAAWQLECIWAASQNSAA